jgi:signal transduction histidine kinase
MIKRISLVVILVGFCVFSFAQNQNSDSLKSLLNQATNPLDRFDLINNILLDITSFRGDNIDSTGTIQLLQLAQELDNDSLLAISYNWLGSYFYNQKGDNISALEYYFKALPLAAKTKNKRRISSIYFDMALVYFDMQDNERALEVTRKGGENLPNELHPLYNFMVLQFEGSLVQYFLIKNNADSAFYHIQKYNESSVRFNRGVQHRFFENINLGKGYAIKGNVPKAEEYFLAALDLNDSIGNITSQLYFYNNYIAFLLTNGRNTEGLNLSKELLNMGLNADNNNLKVAGAAYLRQFYHELNQIDSAYYYSQMEAAVNNELFSQENQNKVQSLAFSEQLRSIEEENRLKAYQNRLEQYALIGGLCMVILIALILFRNNLHKRKSNKVLEQTLYNLKSTQTQLIQSEKMASLGELTAGIAHEIQNPLNFVNNFSELNQELVNEAMEELEKKDYEETKVILKDIADNSGKITHHGKRADTIVKGMLAHSRIGKGEKALTDLNALAEEYLKLSYHGLRAKDKSFNADFKTDFDPNLPKMEVVPQDIGRVLLNLFNNAFQEVSAAALSTEVLAQVDSEYKPLVTVSTKKTETGIEISVADNGNGIPDTIKEKIFQPFFTTKPTGQGTGLGLSLSYDIVKAHGGELRAESKEGEGSKFIIKLPV